MYSLLKEGAHSGAVGLLKKGDMQWRSWFIKKWGACRGTVV
jgi:hypothetical protein